MRLGYNDFKSTVKTLMLNNNTTTASFNLSQGLTSTGVVKIIDCKDIDYYPVKASELPAIFLKWDAKSAEQLIDIKNNNADREVDVNLKISCVSQQYTAKNTDDALELLVDNVESFFRTNIGLNNYSYSNSSLVFCFPNTIDFVLNKNDTYVNKVANINLNCKFIIRSS